MNVVHCRKSYSNGLTRYNPTFGIEPVKESFYKQMENKIVETVMPIFPKQKVLSEGKSKFIAEKVGTFNTAINRLIIGAFAFATQPWIDLFNPNVDSETQKMSCLRTCAKVIIGTATGVGVRWFFTDYLIPKYTAVGEDLKKAKDKKLATCLLPSEKLISREELSKSKRLLKHHRNVIGTALALAAMMITDPPLTLFLTNFFNKHFNSSKKATQKPQNASLEITQSDADNKEGIKSVEKEVRHD